MQLHSGFIIDNMEAQVYALENAMQHVKYGLNNNARVTQQIGDLNQKFDKMMDFSKEHIGKRGESISNNS